MRYLLFFYLSIAAQSVHAQHFRHEFTNPKDSVKLRGLRLHLEIDSIYQVSDSSGVVFALEMVNEGDRPLRLTNPLYNTQLFINPNMWILPSKKRIVLKEVSRWPNPHLAEGIKPYKLERITISGEEVPYDQYANYWKMDTLSINPGQKIRYQLNLFEQVLADENNDPYIQPLFKGEYYTIFNVSLEIGNYSIRSKPFRFKLRLE